MNSIVCRFLETESSGTPDRQAGGNEPSTAHPDSAIQENRNDPVLLYLFWFNPSDDSLRPKKKS